MLKFFKLIHKKIKSKKSASPLFKALFLSYLDGKVAFVEEVETLLLTGLSVAVKIDCPLIPVLLELLSTDIFLRSVSVSRGLMGFCENFSTPHLAYLLISWKRLVSYKPKLYHNSLKV